ncbi:P1 family peptidase, partial [Rhodovulum sp.]|uniref:P1 family peptidase n=1 Tax=Rhodovulum sp. TaxID=34009 RepID=UPI0017DAB4E2
SASVVLDGGFTVGALVAVNAVGSAVMGGGPHFWAAPFEMGDEFGGLGPGRHEPGAVPLTKLGAGQATTIAILATDAALTQAQATRLAIAAHDGIARALVPSHTPFDGDLVFAAATGARALADPDRDVLMLGHAAACCLARAIARGVFHARPAPGDRLPCWQARFGGV